MFRAPDGSFAFAVSKRSRSPGSVRLPEHISLDVYFAAAVAPIDIFDRMDPAFWQSLRTFRPLSRAESESVGPNRIRVYIARAGDTWQSIAERESRGLAKPSTLAIMNGHAVTDQPRPGQRIKVVVAG